MLFYVVFSLVFLLLCSSSFSRAFLFVCVVFLFPIFETFGFGAFYGLLLVTIVLVAQECVDRLGEIPSFGCKHRLGEIPLARYRSKGRHRQVLGIKINELTGSNGGLCPAAVPDLLMRAIYQKNILVCNKTSWCISGSVSWKIDCLV